MYVYFYKVIVKIKLMVRKINIRWGGIDMTKKKAIRKGIFCGITIFVVMSLMLFIQISDLFGEIFGYLILLLPGVFVCIFTNSNKWKYFLLSTLFAYIVIVMFTLIIYFNMSNILRFFYSPEDMGCPLVGLGLALFLIFIILSSAIGTIVSCFITAYRWL